MYFPCLDHGFVALLDVMGSDAEIARAARQSYGAGTRASSKDNQLIRYMCKHKHSSPFEQLEMKFQVRLPIFVARQLIRHRTANVNEYSLRYSLPSFQFYKPAVETLGKQSQSNKQGRTVATVATAHVDSIVKAWEEIYDRDARLYELLVAPGVDMARELARLHLPLSLYTQWTWKIDFHNLMHFLSLRCHKHAQLEIQKYANLKAAMARRAAPLSFQAWLDYEFQARTFSRMEMVLLRKLLRSAGESGGNSLLTDGTVIGKLDADQQGMSEREWGDFLWNFNPEAQRDFESMFDDPRFQLDLSEGKTGEWYAEEIAKYVAKK